MKGTVLCFIFLGVWFAMSFVLGENFEFECDILERLNSLENKVNAAEEVIADLESKLKASEEEIADLQSKVANVEDKHDALTKQLGVLQCPSCTYVNTEADVPSLIMDAVDGIIRNISEPKCKAMLSGPIPEIKMETCAPPTGHIAMCSFYEGSVNAKIDIAITTFNIPLKMYQQGCFYALSANPPPTGCHDRKNIDEDKSTLLRVLEGASSLVDEVVSFEGKRCVCRDSYCKDVGGGGLVETSTGGLVETSTGGLVETSTGGQVETSTGGLVETSTGGLVETSTGGLVETSTGRD